MFDHVIKYIRCRNPRFKFKNSRIVNQNWDYVFPDAELESCDWTWMIYFNRKRKINGT